ncbi:hypothetical protein V8E52_005209 [Russula decolorans]|jgi:hypothetical protein
MRRYMTFARIFLILSIINSARAAPAVVRRVHEVHVNVADVAEDGTAASQKRWDSEPKDEWLVNTADQTSAPTASWLPDLDHSGLHSPRSSTRLNNAPSSSALSTGPHSRSPPPTPGSSSDSSNPYFSWPDQLLAKNARPPSPEFSWPNYLPANNPRPPSPEFSWPNQLPANNPPPPSPEFSWPSQLPANNPRPPSPDFSWPNQLPANNPRPPSSEPPRPTEPETKDFLSQLDSS